MKTKAIIIDNIISKDLKVTFVKAQYLIRNES